MAKTKNKNSATPVAGLGDDLIVKAFESTDEGEDLSAHDLRIRLFLRHYVQSFNARGAALAMGCSKESAATIGHRYLHHEKTQKLLGEMLRNLDKETELLRCEALSMVIRECNYDDGSPGAHGARVNALRLLVRLLGMDQTTVNANVNDDTKGTGILAVPLAGSPEDWAAEAAKSQGALLNGEDPTNNEPTPPGEEIL
jgi:hypothetical protein